MKMVHSQKIKELRNIIDATLRPLINRDHMLLELPYHSNIGDCLIWEGERAFLSKLPIRCQGSFSLNSKENCKDSSTILLLHGGGNFGDLYLNEREYKRRIISTYPNNPIIQLPQSVWYDNENLLKEDVELLGQHPNLTICARDKWSYDFLKKHFSKNKILLVPDMAFYIDEKILSKYRNLSISGKKIYIKRIDKEYVPSTGIDFKDDTTIADWPTFTKPLSSLKVLKRIESVNKHFGKWLPFMNTIEGLFAEDIFLKDMTIAGLEFLSPYDTVITTRLHAMILATLLHKKVEYIDNSSGKLSAFVSTWFSDLDGVKPYKG